MTQWIQTAQETLAIPWVGALTILLGSLVAAKIVEVILCRIVTRLTRRTQSDLDDRIVQLLHRPVFFSVLLAGVWFAAGRLTLTDGGRSLLLSILHTLIVLIWTGALLRLSSALLEGLGSVAGRVGWIEERTIPLFDNLAKIVIFGGAVYCLMLAWRLDVTPWLASAGIAGIAIGFAAKDTLANFFGGLFVIIDSPYTIGDYINLDSGERGRVVKIGLRSTRLLTRDDIEITLPNAQIANSTIVNESGGPWLKSRVTVRVGVAYGSDVDRVSRVLEETATSVPLVVEDPAPRIREGRDVSETFAGSGASRRRNSADGGAG
jgi:small-conductance mechanosensitive channel